ncbi:hypothetical protein N7478_006052 [Penicillium angulare]|uniref:uncharacterized protein n=1 Tax=Penicillium angulare TaxID=116970 RepID=UPI002541D06F|nr:uncharacterized protein N7478_006052 [Penicillium angulare]KAJ5280680.1 hypothetical protein N7478_006052 [Penicillium angulare]
MSGAIDSIATGSQFFPEDVHLSRYPGRQSRIPEEWHPSSLRPGRRDSDTPSATSTDSAPAETDLSNYPNGSKSLSGISLRAFLLGTSLGLASAVTLFLTIFTNTGFWRVPFFIASLSLFHFLEFYVTATYNTSAADVTAFLLSSNGWAYNVAHGAAMVECIVAHYFWPGQSALGKMIAVTVPFYGPAVSPLLILGLGLVLLGQVVRTFAMAQAASNFNHHVQSEHRQGHVLVTHGLYQFLRHPSYFGFFWWGLGTQLVLGNVVCFVGYSLVLWKFFYTRIEREEAFLIRFFGAEYVQFKEKTPVGIPFIR